MFRLIEPSSGQIQNIVLAHSVSANTLCVHSLNVPVLPYILKSNPHPFYSFRGLRNQMRIRFAVESWILEK